MDRRQFLLTTSATLFSTMVAGNVAKSGFAMPFEIATWRPSSPLLQDGPAPRPEITAVVDVIVPPDPDIPGDFKGSDYGGDWVLAATLGEMGQLAVVLFLNHYAKQIAGVKFINCTPEDQLEAVKEWIRDRTNQPTVINEMLTGVLTISMIGTYEENDPEDELELFEAMNWYDPNDPTGTFRLPCEGYPDSFIFPVALKKGVKE